MLTNDRKASGLILPLSIIANTTLAGLRELSPGGWRRPAREREAAERTTAPMRLHAASLELEVSALSGGNQQKVVVAKWLFCDPKILIFDEPTRGIDVGTKYAIYELIGTLASEGIGIIMISSDLPEILGLTDRILVLHEGELAATLITAETTQEEVLKYAAGLAKLQ